MTHSPLRRKEKHCQQAYCKSYKKIAQFSNLCKTWGSDPHMDWRCFDAKSGSSASKWKVGSGSGPGIRRCRSTTLKIGLVEIELVSSWSWNLTLFLKGFLSLGVLIHSFSCRWIRPGVRSLEPSLDGANALLLRNDIRSLHLWLVRHLPSMLNYKTRRLWYDMIAIGNPVWNRYNPSCKPQSKLYHTMVIMFHPCDVASLGRRVP
jgi:hypothetical protein